MKKAIFAVSLCLLVFSLNAEPVRVQVAGVLEVRADNSESQKLSMAFQDAFGIAITPSPFLQGIEIELKIPSVLAKYKDFFVWFLYQNINPKVDKNIVSYDAERIVMKTIPDRLSMVIQIPLKKNHTLKSTPYSTVLSEPIDAQTRELLFRIMPAMKGIPLELEKAVFQVKVRPLLTDEGLASIKLKYPNQGMEKLPVSIFIDDKLIENINEAVLLKAGNHYLTTRGDDFRDEHISFVVEQGKTLNLDVILHDTTPVLVIEAPENALFYIDGSKVEAKAFEEILLEAGEHTLLVKLGDYSLSRKINLQKGRLYKLVLMIDIQIQEEN